MLTGSSVSPGGRDCSGEVCVPAWGLAWSTCPRPSPSPCRPRVWRPDTAGLPAASSHGRLRLLLCSLRFQKPQRGLLLLFLSGRRSPLSTLLPLFSALTPPPCFWTEEWGLVLIWGPGTVRRDLCPSQLGGGLPTPLLRAVLRAAVRLTGSTAPASWPPGLPLPRCPLSLGLGVYRLWWAGARGGRGQRTTVDAVIRWEEEARTS